MKVADIKTWVLLRGLSREQQHWGEFIDLCRVRFPDRQFVTLDLPGCGIHFREPSPLSIAGIRNHLEKELALCSSISASEPIGLITLSLGSMVALDWWNHDNHRIAAVVVMNTSANNNPVHWRFRLSALGPAIKAILSWSSPRREAYILRMVSQRYYADQHLIMQWQEIQKQHPVSVLTFVKQLIAAARFTLPATLPADNGLVLASSNDQMVSSRCSKTIAAKYNWPLALNNLAGHELTLDQPVWVVDQLEQWWS